MQLRVHPTMDCSGRSTSNIERDSDLGDDLVRTYNILTIESTWYSPSSSNTKNSPLPYYDINSFLLRNDP